MNVFYIFVKGGIEGEENLFATLEMEANKPEEDLLAEALLLQDELTDDLTETVSMQVYNSNFLLHFN